MATTSNTHSRPKRIVIADDESPVLHVLGATFRKAGFEVFTAMDGEEALDLCRAELPHALVTDFQMPRMNGLDLCRELGRVEATSKIVTVMLTACGFEIDSAELSAVAIRCVLEKPFSPKEVLRTVENLIADAVCPVTE